MECSEVNVVQETAAQRNAHGWSGWGRSTPRINSSMLEFAAGAWTAVERDAQEQRTSRVHGKLA